MEPFLDKNDTLLHVVYRLVGTLSGACYNGTRIWSIILFLVTWGRNYQHNPSNSLNILLSTPPLNDPGARWEAKLSYNRCHCQKPWEGSFYPTISIWCASYLFCGIKKVMPRNHCNYMVNARLNFEGFVPIGRIGRFEFTATWKAPFLNGSISTLLSPFLENKIKRNPTISKLPSLNSSHCTSFLLGISITWCFPP